MAKSTRTQRARDAARSAGSNPYLRRLIDDDELRESIRGAFDAARDAYGRVQNGKRPADALIDDKKLHRDLKVAAENVRDATDRLRGRRRERRWGRLLLIGVAAAVLAIVLSEDLRKAVLDKLFGAEEEFEYASTTAAAPEPEVTEA
ncbi:MAG TPA: hypothetical protein VK919_11795 [Solirubrobacterales bacterium]|nr:hypothetical protein [Solirubrobacterales bacterium]